MSSISDLKPTGIWHYFDEILKIPRPSKKEGKIIAYIENFAIQHQFDYKKDSAGNIVINKPASKGYTSRKKTILQSHVDMVCEKNEDIRHDFENDPIEAYIENDWIKAKGTTLGSDNGIGIAAQLAVLTDNTLKHGPIECLFTVDEETGLTGASMLEPDFINGSILLNLDSEDEGELFIGCAGGADTIIRIPYQSKPINKKYIAYSVLIKGLTGGHSGDDINKGFGNSIKILSRIIRQTTQQFKLKLCQIQGGNLRNAIPREARAIIALKAKHENSFLDSIENFTNEIKNELKSTEPNLTFTCEKVSLPETSMKKKQQYQLLNSLHACPHGVIEMSRDIPGLVETSTNLASINFIDDKSIEVVTSQRSSYESAKKNISSQIESLFMLMNATVIITDTYPGWAPNRNSEIVNITEALYEELFAKKPVVRAIHAGLECGLFLRKYPWLDMISFGPTIKGAHSPGERLEISSVNKFWQLLTVILEKIPEA
jgi:dipeptidase D